MTIETQTPAAPSVEEATAASIALGQQGLTESTPAAVTPAAGAPIRPDHIPEQFWKADGTIDTDGMAKSYAELRAKMDAPKAEATPETPPVKPNGAIAKPKVEEPAAAAPLTSAMELARNEYATTQAVSEETVAALEAAGIPQEVFNLYLEGVKATEAKALSEIYSYAGDQEQYNLMSTWAAEKLSDGELEAYNTAIENPAMRENAVRGLAARYAVARPSEGRLLTPSGGTGGSSDTYGDRDEFVADTKNPKYATDPKFRAEVQDKLRRSQQSGFSVVPRNMFEKQVLSNR